MQASEKKYIINRIRRRIQWENAAQTDLDRMRAKSWSVEEIHRTIRILASHGVKVSTPRRIKTPRSRVLALKKLRTRVRELGEDGRDLGHATANRSPVETDQ